MRAAAIVGVVWSLGAAVTGCSLLSDGEMVITQTSQSIAAGQALATLASELDAFEHVESVSTGVDAIMMSASIDVEVRSDAEPSTMREILAALDAGMRAQVFEPFTLTFFAASPTLGVRYADFPGHPVDYDAESAYWEMLRGVLGATAHVHVEFDPSHGAWRYVGTSDDAAPAALVAAYDRVAAVPVPNGIPTRWVLPGVSGHLDHDGPLPDADLLGFLAHMARVTNLLDEMEAEAPPGFWLSTRGDATQFSFVANGPGNDVDEAGSWRVTVDMVDAALATGLSALRLQVQTFDGGGDAMLHRGECAESLEPTRADVGLVERLTAEGVDLDGVVPGQCARFES